MWCYYGCRLSHHTNVYLLHNIIVDWLCCRELLQVLQCRWWLSCLQRLILQRYGHQCCGWCQSGRTHDHGCQHCSHNGILAGHHLALPHMWNTGSGNNCSDSIQVLILCQEHQTTYQTLLACILEENLIIDRYSS